MPVTQAELDEMYAFICPTCAAGHPVRYRPETKEFTHDVVTKKVGDTRVTTVAHGICWANGLRNSHYAEKAKAQAIVEAGQPKENGNG